MATQSECLLTFCHSKLHVCWGVLRYLLYMLVWCLTFSHACWYGVSLSAVTAGVVLHYMPCFLVWYFLSTMPVVVAPHYRHCLEGFWCGASQQVMSSGVVPHYRPCLLAWYLTIGHTCCSVLHLNRHFD